MVDVKFQEFESRIMNLYLLHQSEVLNRPYSLSPPRVSGKTIPHIYTHFSSCWWLPPSQTKTAGDCMAGNRTYPAWWFTCPVWQLSIVPRIEAPSPLPLGSVSGHPSNQHHASQCPARDADNLDTSNSSTINFLCLLEVGLRTSHQKLDIQNTLIATKFCRNLN